MMIEIFQRFINLIFISIYFTLLIQVSFRVYFKMIIEPALGYYRVTLKLIGKDWVIIELLSSLLVKKRCTALGYYRVTLKLIGKEKVYSIGLL
jgi:hypothetical protein